MAFVINAQHHVPSELITALQRLDPERLDQERNQFDSDPPPPYPSSGETTQPPSPRSPVEDEFAKQYALRKRRNMSRPGPQFERQTNRERKRLIYQCQNYHTGRKETLPFDESMDYKANAQNNVRGRWVEQGIWMDDWGPAWPKGSEPMTTRWRFSKQRPDFYPEPGHRWPHEPEPEQMQDQEQEQQSTVYHSVFGPSKPEGLQTAMQGPDRAPGLSPPEKEPTRDCEASRPYHQFFYQISKEREWVRDELAFKGITGADIDKMAYDSVKSNWIEDGIWNPKWDEMPGMMWAHEERAEEQEILEVRNGNTCGVADQQPRMGTEDNAQQSLVPKYNNLFETTTVEGHGGCTGNRASPPAVLEGAEASRTTSKQTRRTSDRHLADTESSHGRDKLTDGVFQTASKSSAQVFPAVKPHQQSEPLPPEPATMSNTDVRRKRGRRHEATDDKQPSKRRRRSTKNQNLDLPRNKASDATASVRKPRKLPGGRQKQSTYDVVTTRSGRVCRRPERFGFK